MPCNCDHMKPHQLELEISKVACLLDELNGKPINKNHWDGYHPDVYGSVLQTGFADKLTAKLCKKLQKLDVTKYSLEMQIWWRDHQIADKQRITDDLAKKKKKKDKELALKKLTRYEKKLLGI